MKIIKDFLSEYKIPTLLAFIHWYTTTLLQIDRNFFTYETETKYMIVIKILYLFVLLISWNFVFFCRNQVRDNNDLYKRGILIFSVYFSILLAFLLILWPGTWSWDDIGILRGILSYGSFVPWQHFLSGLYQAVLLQIIPHPGGIILLQNLVISVCVAFSVVKLENAFQLYAIKNKYIDVLVKILPFLTPPVLLYQFSGYRMGIYVYLELVVLVSFICACKDRKQWKITFCVFLGILIAIVSSWRSESLFYILFFPLALIFVRKDVLFLWKKIICICISIILFIQINNLQNHCLENNNYQVISMMGPYSAIVRAADYKEDKEDLEIINRVADIDKILANPSHGGEALYWTDVAYRDGYSTNEFKESVLAVVRLSLKYPKQVFLERWNMFITATGIKGNIWSVNNQSISLFEQDGDSSHDEWFAERGYFPSFKKLRAVLINLLDCNSPSGAQIGCLRRIVWNAWIPMIVLVYAWFSFVRRKQWYYLMICTAVIMRIPVVFLTEPAGWIMYLLSFYFLGYVFLIYKILVLVGRNKKNE